MKIRRPNAVIYFLIFIFVFPLMKFLFSLKVDKSRFIPPNGPFIVVSNHSSFADFLIVMLSLYPHRMNSVAAQKFFLYKPLTWFLPMMGAIPKNLFDPDVRSIIGIKTVLKRGGKILLFPEGRCACDGVYAGMHKSTGKLIKKLNVPVVSCSIEGAYTCMPFWRKGLKRGRVRIIVSNLFSEDCLKSLSVKQITHALDLRLSRAEDPPPDKPFQTFSSKNLAEGLENILYWCPKCDSEFALRSDNCTIRCSVCGNAAVLDKFTKFAPLSDDCVIFSGIHEWYREQARYEGRKLHPDMEPIGENVSVGLPSEIPGEGMTTCGNGEISISPDGWRFTGTVKGKETSLFFPIDTVPAVPIDPNEVFQIYAGGTFYTFTPQDARKCVQYSVLGEAAYWRFASNSLMTPRRDGGFCYEN
ncbi:MAG: 1-acyl-sn-glycerol-3-phosphate acyltransferase [Oscillospiraceae bacterium]|nr:1-acyl-sn-glycerol-3-phosphate acyltransferase [Oscillospiraceae bacterium]MCL2278186.1 1-acyl-sn-glycerol-3-phosphate acyltransferase [Oscillospiraceae bacterium]